MRGSRKDFVYDQINLLSAIMRYSHTSHGQVALQSTNHRTILNKPVWCYKTVFSILLLSGDELFKFSDVGTRCHGYQLNKAYSATDTRYWFFTQRVINVWKNLPQDRPIVDFTSLASSQRIIDFSAYLKVFV